MKTKHTLLQAAAGITLLAAALLQLGGCANPDDFTSLRNDCPEGTFDLPERDRFCSGEADMDEVRFASPLGFEAGAPVRVIQRDGMLLLAGTRAAEQELAVVPLPAPGQPFAPAGYWRRSFGQIPQLASVTRVESLALLEDKLMLVHDGGAVKILRAGALVTSEDKICVEQDGFNDDGDEDGGDGTATPPDSGTGAVEESDGGDATSSDDDVVGGEEGGDIDPEVVCQGDEPVCERGALICGTLPAGQKCPESEEDLAAALDLRTLFANCDGPIGVRSFEPLQLASPDRSQRFAILNTTCGATVLGRAGVDSAAPAYFLAVEDAADIKFDPIGQRIFVAEGAQGLRVRYTGSISQQLSTVEGFSGGAEDLSDQVNTSSSACGEARGEQGPAIDGDNNFSGGNNAGGNNPGNGGDPTPPPENMTSEPPKTSVPPPTPIYDTEQAQAVIDPSLQEQINVTSVNFDADRVFFINGAAGADAPATALVVARLTPANTLESRESLELPVEDLKEDAVNYTVTPLRDDLLLVVREATSGLQAWIVDAPLGRPPRLVLTLPTDADTLAVVARSERVSLVRNQGVQSWTLRATGKLR